MRYSKGGYLIRARGLTLIEVMFAISLALLIIGALTKIYLSMHAVFRQQQIPLAHERLARQVVSLLDDEILLAGHIGCAKLTDTFKARVVTDNTITVRYQSSQLVETRQDVVNGMKIVTDNNLHYNKDDFLVISNCEHAEVFKVAAVKREGDTQIIIPQAPLHFIYSRYAEIGKYAQHQYYVETRNNVGRLIRLNNSMRKEVMMENINNLHFTQDDSGIHYQFDTTSFKQNKTWYRYVSWL